MVHTSLVIDICGPTGNCAVVRGHGAAYATRHHALSSAFGVAVDGDNSIRETRAAINLSAEADARLFIERQKAGFPRTRTGDGEGDAAMIELYHAQLLFRSRRPAYRIAGLFPSQT